MTSRPKCDVTKSWKKDHEHAAKDFINQEHAKLKVGNGGENNKKRKEFEDENETGSDEKRLKMEESPKAAESPSFASLLPLMKAGAAVSVTAAKTSPSQMQLSDDDKQTILDARRAATDSLASLETDAGSDSLDPFESNLVINEDDDVTDDIEHKQSNTEVEGDFDGAAASKSNSNTQACSSGQKTVSDLVDNPEEKDAKKDVAVSCVASSASSSKTTTFSSIEMTKLSPCLTALQNLPFPNVNKAFNGFPFQQQDSPLVPRFLQGKTLSVAPSVATNTTLSTVVHLNNNTMSNGAPSTVKRMIDGSLLPRPIPSISSNKPMSKPVNSVSISVPSSRVAQNSPINVVQTNGVSSQAQVSQTTSTPSQAITSQPLVMNVPLPVATVAPPFAFGVNPSPAATHVPMAPPALIRSQQQILTMAGAAQQQVPFPGKRKRGRPPKDRQKLEMQMKTLSSPIKQRKLLPKGPCTPVSTPPITSRKKGSNKVPISSSSSGKVDQKCPPHSASPALPSNTVTPNPSSSAGVLKQFPMTQLSQPMTSTHMGALGLNGAMQLQSRPGSLSSHQLSQLQQPFPAVQMAAVPWDAQNRQLQANYIQAAPNFNVQQQLRPLQTFPFQLFQQPLFTMQQQARPLVTNNTSALSSYNAASSAALPSTCAPPNSLTAQESQTQEKQNHPPADSQNNSDKINKGSEKKVFASQILSQLTPKKTVCNSPAHKKTEEKSPVQLEDTTKFSNQTIASSSNVDGVLQGRVTPITIEPISVKNDESL